MKMLTNIHIVVMTVLCSVLVQVDSKCPTFFEEYNMACYYIGSNYVNNANDAFKTCYSLGGYLLNINAVLENDHVVNKIQQQPTIFDGYWIGGFFNGQQWLWQKTDQTGNVVEVFMNPEEAQYRNWGPEQPNAHGLLVYRPYVAIMTRHRTTPYRWYSENGFVRMPGGMSYVCEADWQSEKMI